MTDDQKASLEYLHQTLDSVETPKILIVEDDVNDVELHLRVLDQFKCEVVIAKTSEEGVKLITEDGIDLILLDAKLPTNPPEDVIAAAAGLIPDASVVMVTGYPDSVTKSAAIKKGAKLILEKPLTDVQVSAFLHRKTEPPCSAPTTE